MFASIIDPTEWVSVCASCATAGEQAIRQLPAFVEVCQDRRAAAQIALDERLSRLRVRYELHHKMEMGTLDGDDLQSERVYAQAVLDGMTDPVFELDSAGLIVLSSEPPAAQ
jgi:hypothetical protein